VEPAKPDEPAAIDDITPRALGVDDSDDEPDSATDIAPPPVVLPVALEVEEPPSATLMKPRPVIDGVISLVPATVAAMSPRPDGAALTAEVP